MSIINEIFNVSGTGDDVIIESNKLVKCRHDKYNIYVRIDNNNHFLGIEDVEVNKSFIPDTVTAAGLGYHDVESFYED